LRLVRELQLIHENRLKEAEKLSKGASGRLDDDEEPLSRPPSPFLSADHYYANLASRRKARKSGNESSKAAANRPVSQNSDRMSLSRYWSLASQMCQLHVQIQNDLEPILRSQVTTPRVALLA
jgi:hypothetical protein